MCASSDVLPARLHAFRGYPRSRGGRGIFGTLPVADGRWTLELSTQARGQPLPNGVVPWPYPLPTQLAARKFTSNKPPPPDETRCHDDVTSHAELADQNPVDGIGPERTCRAELRRLDRRS